MEGKQKIQVPFKGGKRKLESLLITCKRLRVEELQQTYRQTFYGAESRVVYFAAVFRNVTQQSPQKKLLGSEYCVTLQKTGTKKITLRFVFDKYSMDLSRLSQPIPNFPPGEKEGCCSA